MVSKRVVSADVPPERKPERGYVRQNHPFTKPPFYLPVSLFGVDKRVVSKRVVSADVPPGRTPERGYVRQNHPFTKPPFYLPVSPFAAKAYVPGGGSRIRPKKIRKNAFWPVRVQKFTFPVKSCLERFFSCCALCTYHSPLCCALRFAGSMAFGSFLCS